MNPLTRPLWAAIASWIIGSLLIVAFIFAINPRLFGQWWLFYILYTFGFAFLGVFTIGLLVLAAVSYLYPPQHKIFHPLISLLAGAFSGWLAMVAIGAVITAIGGTLHKPSDFSKLLFFGLFGSVYGIAGFLSLSILSKKYSLKAEQDAAANP